MTAEQAIFKLEKAQEMLAQNQTLLSEKDSSIVSLQTSVVELSEQNALLSQLVQQQEQMLEQLENKLKSAQAGNSSLMVDIKNLEYALKLIRQKIYGAKSESKTPSSNTCQTELFQGVDFGQDAETRALSEKEAEKEKKQAQARVSKPGTEEKELAVRMELPASLEREVIVLDPEGVDLEQMVKIGEEITEHLLVEPASVKVRRYVRNKYALKANDQAPTSGSGIPQGRVYIAPLPDTAIAKVKCCLETIAWLLTCKYVDHLAIHRCQKILARSGIEIKYNTLLNWVHQGANRLVPLLDTLKQVILQSGYLMVDETPCKVIDRTAQGNITRGHYWVYRAKDTGLVLYDYNSSRSGEVPLSMLSSFKGYVQCDGYGGYNELFRQNQSIKRLGCLAHARRKFHEALVSDEKRATEALMIIQRMYVVEKTIRESQPCMGDEEIKNYRQLHAKPIWADYEAWLKQTAREVKAKSPLYKAIYYSTHELENMKRYMEQGYLLIDNNWVENSIRPSALGRKNYLYAGSPETAQNSALIYSLTESCRIHNINTYEYIVDVLERIPSTSIHQLEELLPHKWQPLKKDSQPTIQS